jgi:hypothetical protein
MEENEVREFFIEMENVIVIQGQVSFPITIDPTVWIFDDRKVDLTTYFEKDKEEVEDEIVTYTKAVSKHWDREIREGAAYPPINRSLNKYEKDEALTGSFGIPLTPFIKNSEPKEGATTLSIETKDGESYDIPLSKAHDAILGFSKDGKPVADGPVHFYYGDGSNKDNPIKNIVKFLIK